VATVMRSPDQHNDASPTPPRKGRLRASLESAARRMRDAVTGKAAEADAPTTSTASEIPPPPNPDAGESRPSLRVLAKALLEEDRSPEHDSTPPPEAAGNIGSAPEPASKSVPPPLPRRSSAPPAPVSEVTSLEPVAHAEAQDELELPPPPTRAQLLRARLEMAKVRVAESQARMAAAEAAVVASAAALGIELDDDSGEHGDHGDYDDEDELEDLEDEELEAAGEEDAELGAADGGEIEPSHAAAESEPPSAIPHPTDYIEAYEDELEPVEPSAESAQQS
jgi:hypothetical protein